MRDEPGPRDGQDDAVLDREVAALVPGECEDLLAQRRRAPNGCAGGDRFGQAPHDVLSQTAFGNVLLRQFAEHQANIVFGRTALSSARILMIPAGNIRLVFERDADFARSMVRELSARYRDMAKLLKNQKLRTSVERLANYLVVEH